MNPHVILNSIEKYRYSQKLPSHGSLTTYLNELKSGMLFPEIEAQNTCKYNEYKRVFESYVGKDRKLNEYIRTARVDQFEPVYLLVEKLKDLSDKYLLHWTYVDNYTSVFPILKEVYGGHPHGTYPQKGREGVKTNAYDCVQRVSRLSMYAKKIFFGPQNLKTSFFCTKEAITWPFIIVYRKV